MVLIHRNRILLHFWKQIKSVHSVYSVHYSTPYSTLQSQRPTVATAATILSQGIRKMSQLHAEAEEMIKLFKIGGVPYQSCASIEEARYLSRKTCEKFQTQEEFKGTITEMSIDTPAAAIPVTVYKPEQCDENPAVFVYFHGGGWTVGSRVNGDSSLKYISSRARCIAVNVEYRLAPEHPFPACMDDARDVTSWILKNRLLIGATEDSPVGVGGDSAGGTIASVVAHEVKPLVFQVLVYPNVDLTYPYPSYKEFGAAHYILSEDTINWFADQFIPNKNDRVHPRASVIRQPSFSNLPPAMFIVAECDAIRDDSYEYEKKLQAAGTPTEFILFKGVLHGFFHLPGHYRENCPLAYDHVVRFIQRYGKSSSAR